MIVAFCKLAQDFVIGTTYFQAGKGVAAEIESLFRSSCKKVTAFFKGVCQSPVLKIISECVAIGAPFSKRMSR